jgi:hypothetical protein
LCLCFVEKLLDIFFFQALNFLVESFGLINDLFPLPSILDAGYPVLDLHLADVLCDVIKHENIINHIKAQKLSWFGHVQRMPDTRTVKKMFNWKPLTKRSQGRPKYRWEDNITELLYIRNAKLWRHLKIVFQPRPGPPLAKLF